MRKLVIAGILVAALATLVIQVGFRTADANKAEDWPTVTASRQTMIESTIATGTIKPQVGAEVKVGSQLSGIVAKLHVNVGDNVERGAPLALLDDSQWRARASTLRSDLAAALAESEYAEQDLQRLERLAASVATSQIDNARRNAAVRTAIVQRIEAQLAEAQLQLSYTSIVAPISGTVASISTFEGETVAASFAAPTFVTIIDLTRLEIQAYVDETDIGKVRIGQTVTFKVNSYAADDLNGTVRAIYPKAQFVNNVVNYVVIINIDDMKGLLIRPEMTAHVTFILEKKENVLSVPRAAVSLDSEEDFVVVQTSSGWIRRAVTPGMQAPRRIEIISGLAGEDQVLANVQLWKDSLLRGER